MTRIWPGFKAIQTPQTFALPFEAAKMIKIRYLGVGWEFCFCKWIQIVSSYTL